MKKFTVIALIAVIAVSLFATCILTACVNNDGKIRLNEVTHSIFYAPLYIAINNGYFEEEGLEIELTNGGGSDKSMTALISGQADVALLGPETALYVKAQGAENNAVIFGQLTKKDGSFLIGRTAEPDFSWAGVAGKEVIGGRQGGMPAMCLEAALVKNGLNKGVNYTMNYDVQFDLITAAFEAGTGDYCTMFEPAASQYQAAGKGYIVASVGAEAGVMPYTCFMATKSYIADHGDKVEKFMSAVMKGIDFVFTATDAQLADALRNSFPGVSDEILAKSVRSYIAIDAYMTSPIMQENEFNNLVDLLTNAGTLTKRVAFTDVVDNSIAQKLKAQAA